MPNWTEADLAGQFHEAVASGWLPFFEGAGTSTALPVELLLGIASRETNIQNIKGDLRDGVYHGYGVMQVDILTEPQFCRNWTPDQVQDSIRYGALVLSGKRDYLAHHGITDTKAIAASYNTGEGNVVRSVQAGIDPDRTTSGGDYGRDVLARMDVFAKLRGSVLAFPKKSWKENRKI